MPKRHSLARNSFCRIDQLCGCGRVIEVSVGAFSLRFDAGSLRKLGNTINEALSKLERESEEAALLLDVKPAPRGQA